MNRLLQPEIMVIFLCLFSLGLPLSVFTIRELVKDKRYQIGTKLVDDFPNLKLAHSYIFAMAKYGKNVPEHATSNVKRLSIWVKNLGLPGYSVPIGTYVLISFTGFYCTIALTVDSSETKYPFGNYLLYGMYAGVDIVGPKGVAIVGPKQSTTGNETTTTSPPGTNDKLPPEVRSSASRRTYTVDEIRQYERGTMAVLVAAFLGSYLWTLIYLARRVTNFDLSPFSFLRATIQISLACFVSIFFRHLYDALPQMLWNTSSSQSVAPTTSSWLLALAFLIGFYPALGLNYLQE